MKPCPFCNGIDLTVILPDPDSETQFFPRVVCNNINCEASAREDVWDNAPREKDCININALIGEARKSTRINCIASDKRQSNEET